MVNQNPEPIVLTESFEIQAGTSTEDVELTHQMASPEEMNLFALYVYMYPGYLDIGESDDYPDGRRTYTDIAPIYIPVNDNDDRPDDHAAADPLYVTLPLCCNPRPWTDLTLSILVGNNQVPSRVIDIGVVASKLDRTLPFSTPIKVMWDQRLYLKLQNNNPAAQQFDTFSKVDIALNGEIVNLEQLRMEQAVAQARKERAIEEARRKLAAR
jgi:hypothetical protein